MNRFNVVPFRQSRNPPAPRRPDAPSAYICRQCKYAAAFLPMLRAYWVERDAIHGCFEFDSTNRRFCPTSPNHPGRRYYEDIYPVIPAFCRMCKEKIGCQFVDVPAEAHPCIQEGMFRLDYRKLLYVANGRFLYADTMQTVDGRPHYIDPCDILSNP